MEKTQAFQALSKICLNNWHYIDKKVLTLKDVYKRQGGRSEKSRTEKYFRGDVHAVSDHDGREI